jgi:two-component system, OmpR family, KDP operon response regulator KdpE
MLILIVDDDRQIRKLLQTGLMGYGYDALTAADGQEALALAAQRDPSLIILDIALGSEPDGLAVCRRLREWSQTPILILSVRDDEATIVSALDAGADDYLTKPFGMEELRARMQAVLRRVAVEPASTSYAEIVFGDVHVDLANRRVTVAGTEVHFTPLEYDVLRLLVTHRGQIITHQTILSKVWGAEYTAMTHYVRIYVNQIRKKLGENPAANIRYILNEPGIGYRFLPPG